MTACVTSAKNSGSVREASSGENSNVFTVAEGALDAFHGAFENLALSHLEFELAMDGARGEEHVNAGAVARRFHGLGGAVDVFIDATGQPGDARALDLARDGFHGLEIAVAGDGEARLDDVHAQPRQLPRDLKFFANVHGCARALLAVAQRGVEYQYLLTHGLILSILAVDRGQTTKNPLPPGDSGFRFPVYKPQPAVCRVSSSASKASSRLKLRFITVLYVADRMPQVKGRRAIVQP